MRSSYIELKLTDKNEFRAEAAFEINGMVFSKVNVKIDTGCPRTAFPMLRLGLSDSEAYKLKAQDCANNSIAKSISFGVNDTRQKKEEDKRRAMLNTSFSRAGTEVTIISPCSFYA